jgi:hypothetical protein
MSTLIGGRPAVDPATHYKECQIHGLPTDWWGKANAFSTALGMEPGRGKLLMRFYDLNSLDLNSEHDLTFSGTDKAHKYTFKRITVRAAECISPGGAGAPNAVFLVDVSDRREDLAKIPIDKAYNVSALDGTEFLANTLNGGAAWTWQGIVDNIVTALGLSTSEFVLPFTPQGQPENLTYWGVFAWYALNDVLDRIACAVQYDGATDTFSIVRLGVADSEASAELAVLEKTRTWDGYPFDPVRAWRPEKVRVRFHRRPRPTDGSTPYYNVDITLPATTGVIVGTYALLEDDATALGATGAPTNAATLATRAQERADDWIRKRRDYGRRLLKVFRDFEPDVPGKVLGSTIGRVGFDDRGGPMRTEIKAVPDSVLEKWRALNNLHPWFPPDASDGGGGGGGNAACAGKAWWLDAQALIDAASQNDPVRVLTLEVFSGAAGGRCDCIPEQFTPTAASPYDGVHQLFWDAGTASWIGTRLVRSCCSCGLIKFTIVNNTAGGNTWPPITGTLTLAVTCDSSSPKTYELRYLPECSTPLKAWFAAHGPKLCTDDPDPIICPNEFYLSLECDDCAIPNLEDCNQCQEICEPSLYVVHGSGFGGTRTVYNQDWPLEKSGDCQWEVTCGGITVTMTLGPTGTNNTTQMTVAFAGAAGGGATFQYNEPEEIVGQGANVECFADHTVPWLSGDDPNDPPSVVVEALFCETCADFCASINYSAMAASVSNQTGDCSCVALSLASFVAGASATFGLTGCANNVQLHVRCNQGRLRLDISGSAFQSFSEVSLSKDPFVWVVDVCFTGGGFDPCGGCFRITFTD